MKFLFLLSKIMSSFPRAWVRRAGMILGWLWFDVFRIRRKIVLDNLTLAFPDWSQEKKIQIARASLFALGANFTELFLIPSMDQKWLEKNVIFEGWEHVQQAMASGRGFYLLGMHLGNGDVMANALVIKGLPIQLITKTFKTRWINKLWFSIRGAKGVEYIEAHGPNTAFSILKSLKKPGAVVFVLDQYMGKPFGIETQFFGRRTGTAYGLALFYQKSQAPILPVYSYQKGEKMHLCVDAPLDLSLADQTEENNLVLTQAFCDKIEQIIRRHPNEWMWVHRRWKPYR